MKNVSFSPLNTTRTYPWWKSQHLRTRFFQVIIYVLLILGCLSFAWILVMFLRRPRQSHLIINREGIRFGQRGSGAEEITWSQFGKATVRGIPPSFQVRDPSGTTLFACPFWLLGGVYMARRCANLINERAPVYKAH